MQGQLREVKIHNAREQIGKKKKLYNFLYQESSAYLPKINCTIVYIMRSKIDGKKEYLKRNEVIVSTALQIEGLTYDDFWIILKQRYPYQIIYLTNVIGYTIKSGQQIFYSNLIKKELLI